MSEDKRFQIEAYGIWDMKSKPDEKLTWGELCDTLNDLWESHDADKLALIERIAIMEKENKELRFLINKIYELVEDEHMTADEIYKRYGVRW